MRVLVNGSLVLIKLGIFMGKLKTFAADLNNGLARGEVGGSSFTQFLLCLIIFLFSLKSIDLFLLHKIRVIYSRPGAGCHNEGITIFPYPYLFLEVWQPFKHQ